MVARRINAERMVLFGWSRSILLQMAHPLIAAGVVDHSHFRSGARMAASRLRGTIRSMLALAYGDAAAYAHRSRRSARFIPVFMAVFGSQRVRFRSARRIRPRILIWCCGCTRRFSSRRFSCMSGSSRPVPAADLDAYCDEAAGIALALGARAHDVPRTWRALEQYLETEYASGRIVVGEDARLVADAVMFPPLSLITGVPAWFNRVITVGLLPAPVRDQYRYRWDDRRGRQFERTIRSMRAIRKVLPRQLAWWPDARR
jgi:uncharacterized protein (DUF2236 family)